MRLIDDAFMILGQVRHRLFFDRQEFAVVHCQFKCRYRIDVIEINSGVTVEHDFRASVCGIVRDVFPVIAPAFESSEDNIVVVKRALAFAEKLDFKHGIPNVFAHIFMYADGNVRFTSFYNASRVQHENGEPG